MMIEGGHIDHALHANDGGTAVVEVLNFDKALAVAFDFYQKHPDETLIVVTADHDTGGMAIVSKGDMKNISYMKVSKGAFSEYCKAMRNSRMVYTWQDMKDYLSENLGFFTHIKISDKQEGELKKMFDDIFENRNSSADEKTLYASFDAFAVKVFGIYNDAVGLNFITGSHTGNPVPVFAVGVGAEKFKGFNNNIGIPKAIFETVTGK